jgi:hypothetical protein
VAGVKEGVVEADVLQLMVFGSGVLRLRLGGVMGEDGDR